MWDEEPERSPVEGEPIHLRPDEVVPEAETELELVADIWAADSHAARTYAIKLVGVARLARRRGAERDAAFGPRGGPGPGSRSLRSAVLAEVSDDFVSELALIRQCSEAEATALAVEALVLTEKLPGTWSELFAGRLDERKARALVDLLADAGDQIAAAVEARVLPGADKLTRAAFRDRVRYHLYRLDEQAKERRRRDAQKRADVRLWPGEDGMSQLGIDLPTPLALACRDALDQYANWLGADGDPRPLGQLRAAVAADLILRPWDRTRPAVTAALTIHAALPALHPDARPGQPPAEVNGQLITAAQCRELLAQLDMLGLRLGPGSTLHLAIGDPATGELLAVATRAELARAAGTGRRRRRRQRRRTHPTAAGRPATATPQSTAGAAGTDPPDGPGLGPPPPTRGYRPTATQRRFITTRDRHCRMPGCRRSPGRCDIDHALPHADGGPTDCSNLCCLCRRHHRIKTFAPGWFFTLLADGRLVVRTPSGVSRITRPPGWSPDSAPASAWLHEQPPETTPV